MLSLSARMVFDLTELITKRVMVRPRRIELSGGYDPVISFDNSCPDSQVRTKNGELNDPIFSKKI